MTGNKDNGRLSILLWSPGGSGLHYHGPAIQTYRLFRAVKNRHDVSLTLVHATHEQEPCAALFDRVVRLPEVNGKGGMLAKYWRQARFIRAGQTWLRDNASDFDVLYTPASNVLTLVPALMGQRLGLPGTCQIAAAQTELFDATPLRSLLGVTRNRALHLKQMAKILSLSKFISERLIELGVLANNIVQMPNSADCQRFRPAKEDEKCAARRRFGIPDTARVVIVCVGALTARKGQHLLVEALKHLPVSTHLLLAGPHREPEYISELQRLIKELDVRERVHDVGHITDVEHAYFASDIFALPSTDEGMPGALVEAMACGLACLGTPISGITDLLDGGDRGRLVERTHQSIVRTLFDYCEHPNLRAKVGAAARTFIVVNQSSEAVADKTFALLRNVAIERAQRS
jgi:glycosyltransferase involved in cell wall biosynthesis